MGEFWFKPLLNFTKVIQEMLLVAKAQKAMIYKHTVRVGRVGLRQEFLERLDGPLLAVKQHRLDIKRNKNLHSINSSQMHESAASLPGRLRQVS